MRVFLGALFVLSGVLKLKNPELFAIDIHNFRIVRDPIPSLIALTLPWLEIFAGLALIARRIYLGALVVLLGSLAVFIVALGSAWIRGLEITCGCFGDSAETTNYPLAIARNLVLIGLAVFLMTMESKSGSQRRGEPRTAS